MPVGARAARLRRLGWGLALATSLGGLVALLHALGESRETGRRLEGEIASLRGRAAGQDDAARAWLEQSIARWAEEGAATRREDREFFESRLEQLGRDLEQARAEAQGCAARAELEELRNLARGSAEILETDLHRDRALRRIFDHYRRGVGLIHGRWTVGRRVGKEFEPLRNDGGEAFDVEYIGTGFLAREDGIVVTNRHVAEPWFDNDDVAPLLARGLQPRFTSLTITFPEREPMIVDPASIVVSEDDVDLAVLRAFVDEVPVLPLSLPDPDLFRGRRVVVLGYPTGIAALLARIERSEADLVLRGADDPTRIIAELAKRHLVEPIITQGSLNDVRERRLIYDAQTTSGGSGGPVFGPDGAVLGISFAVTRAFGGSNFGVPAEFARRLLERVPRKP